MYEFQAYDPARPRMVTSFKGNQKLIFEGYRYNIHHIVQAKGVKTWRCVCAKKLTSARSWCKGRAETWDNDSQGISKGEHNHDAEHEVAELEYFKSQLIMAAIASPTSQLNDLIDEASGYMSHGVSFGSRESLKKSLTVARKSAENGGFKLKCYKNSDSSATRNAIQANASSDSMVVASLTNKINTTIAQQQPLQQKQNEKIADLFPADMKLFDNNGTMLSLLSLARQCQEGQQQQNGKNSQENGIAAAAAAAAATILLNNSNLVGAGAHHDDSINHNNEQSTSSSNCSTSILNHFVNVNQQNLINTTTNNLNKTNGGSNSSTTSSSDFLMDSGLDAMLGDFVGNSQLLAKMSRLDGNNGLMSSASSTPTTTATTAASPFNDSGCYMQLNNSTNSSYQSSGGTKRKHTLNASNMSNFSFSQQFNNNMNQLQQHQQHQQQQQQQQQQQTNNNNNNNNSGRTTPNFMQKQQKAARVNNIFNKLSTKAAIAACTSSASTTNNNNNNINNNYQFSQFAALCSAQLQQQQQNLEDFVDIKPTVVFHKATTTTTKKLYNNTTTSDDNNNKHLISVETQTDSLITTTNEDSITKLNDGIRLSSCIGNTSALNSANKCCGCRIIKVCCCGEETCLRNARTGGASSV